MKKRRRRANRGLWLTAASVIAAASLYVIGAAWLQSYRTSYGWTDLLLPRAVDVVVATWLFWIGSAIGSFLNVVAYRVPRGRGVGGFSACPYCACRIAARDNVPVFGWIALRGRCRVCRLPISPRYPIVELTVGLSIALVGLASYHSGGAHLPLRPITSTGGPLGMPHLPTVVAAITVYHMLAVAAAWALGLVRLDGIRLPGRLVVWVLALSIVPMLAWPPLQVVPWEVSVPSEAAHRNFLDGAMRVLTGLVAAAAVGRLIGQRLCPRADLKLDPLGRQTGRLLDLAILFVVPAVVVGWQALLSVAVAACLAAIALNRWMPRRDGLARLAVALPPALALQVAFWRPLEACPYLPGADASPWVILTALLLVWLLSMRLRSAEAPPSADSVAASAVDQTENGPQSA